MRKIISFCLLFVLLLLLIILFPKKNENKDKNMKTIKVAEVTHSIFYTPQYVAIHKNFFKNNGIDIELILTPGADKVTAAVLSGDVEIGFCGPEATIYVYQSGEKDYLKTFAGLTKKDGSFLVSREYLPNFTLEDLYNIDRIPKGYYFVMGDNRNNSSDSRDYRIGLIKEDEIVGTTRIRLFPFNKIGKFN